MDRSDRARDRSARAKDRSDRARDRFDGARDSYELITLGAPSWPVYPALFFQPLQHNGNGLIISCNECKSLVPFELDTDKQIEFSFDNYQSRTRDCIRGFVFPFVHPSIHASVG